MRCTINIKLFQKGSIANELLHFYQNWFEDNSECEYLIHTPDGKHFQYRNYYDRIEAYIKTQSDTLVDLEEKATKLERKAEIAEMVYEMARGSGGMKP